MTEPIAKSSPAAGDPALLEVDDLGVVLGAGGSAAGAVRVVEGVSLRVGRGQTVGVVGESGSGKTVTALAIMGLLDRSAALFGRVVFDGVDLLTLPERRRRRLRGRRMAMVFQEPASALNPVLSIGCQLTEAMRSHLALDRKAARRRALSLLEQVDLPASDELLRAYPHQLSGGMQQRVMLAAALSCDPALLIADEPTTALDVLAQARVLDLLARLQRERQLAILLITHDFGVLARLAEYALVIHAGRVVDRGATGQLLDEPRHPHTRALVGASPALADRARLFGRASTEVGGDGVVDPGRADGLGEDVR